MTTHKEPGKFGDGHSTALARRLADEWLDENDGAIVSFCTNTMLSRGTIYKCRIINRRAIAFHSQGWWAMNFADPQPIDQDLGEVRPIQYCGMLFYTLGIFKGDSVRPYLKVGRG